MSNFCGSACCFLSLKHYTKSDLEKLPCSTTNSKFFKLNFVTSCDLLLNSSGLFFFGDYFELQTVASPREQLKTGNLDLFFPSYLLQLVTILLAVAKKAFSSLPISGAFG